MNGTQRALTNFGYSLSEFQVFGTQPCHARSMAVQGTVVSVLFAVAAGSCSGDRPPTQMETMDASPDDRCSGGGGGLPAPTCGEGSCGCCVGCSLKNGLCFGTAADFALGIGQCVAAPAAGTFQVTIGASTFVADRVAAIVDGAYLQISARATGQSLVLSLPATLGDGSCTSGAYVGSFAYYRDGASEFHNRPTSPRPGCTVTVGKVGSVGQRIEGSFSVTVLESSTPPTTLDLTNGTFSVERVPFP